MYIIIVHNNKDFSCPLSKISLFSGYAAASIYCILITQNRNSYFDLFVLAGIPLFDDW